MSGFQSFVNAIYSQGGTLIVPGLFLMMLAGAGVALLLNSRKAAGALAIAAVGGTLLYYMAMPLSTSLIAVMPKGA